MRQLCVGITVAALPAMVGCSLGLEVQHAVLRCEHAHEGAFYGFYSFTAGVLTPPVDPDGVDVVYYVDDNDCCEGALIGRDDCPGYIFPIGDESWGDLARLEGPPEDAESVSGIRPLTRDKEGLAFWVKARGGEYILARIRAVEPTTYSDLVSGKGGAVELEWLGPGRAAVSGR